MVEPAGQSPADGAAKAFETLNKVLQGTLRLASGISTAFHQIRTGVLEQLKPTRLMEQIIPAGQLTGFAGKAQKAGGFGKGDGAPNNIIAEFERILGVKQAEEIRTMKQTQATLRGLQESLKRLGQPRATSDAGNGGSQRTAQLTAQQVQLLQSQNRTLGAGFAAVVDAVRNLDIGGDTGIVSSPGSA